MRQRIGGFFAIISAMMILLSSTLLGNITARANSHRVEQAISSVKEHTDRLFERLDRLLFGK